MCAIPPPAPLASPAEAQPFYVNSPFGIVLAHNGNLTNTETLQQELFLDDLRHVNTGSDSEVLLNVLAHELQDAVHGHRLTANDVFAAVSGVHRRCKGAYAVVAHDRRLRRAGLPGSPRHPPLVIGQMETEAGPEYIMASESVAVEALGFKCPARRGSRRGGAGDLGGDLLSQQCAPQSQLHALHLRIRLFRPAGFGHGRHFGIRKPPAHGRVPGGKDPAPVRPPEDRRGHPHSGHQPALGLQLAFKLGLPYREGFIKNRYIGRTFIMPGQSVRKKSVRQKLNAMPLEFKGKNVLLVDDSIVRGTTSREIIQMARDAGRRSGLFRLGQPAGALSQRLWHRHAHPPGTAGQRPHR
jgi:amidophosphoribosyltransferase